MVRQILWVGVVALAIPSLALAEGKKADQRGTSQVLPVSAYGEAKPAGQAVAAPIVLHPGQTAGIPVESPRVSFGERLRLGLINHECAPDGCPKPIGCGNFWTEKKFLFGSCRQFFGTAGASEGHHRRTQYIEP